MKTKKKKKNIFIVPIQTFESGKKSGNNNPQDEVACMDHTTPLDLAKNQILWDIFYHEVSFLNFLLRISWSPTTPFHMAKK